MAAANLCPSSSWLFASKCVPGSEVVVPSDDTNSVREASSAVKRIAARTLSLFSLSNTSPSITGSSGVSVSSRMRLMSCRSRLWCFSVPVFESLSP